MPKHERRKLRKRSVRFCMIKIKTPAEIDKMHQGGRILARILDNIGRSIHAGMRTEEIDEMAEKALNSEGVRSAFKGYNGFPASICVSVNEEVVHGIPGKREIKEGDIVSLDFGLIKDGFYVDSATTVAIGNVISEGRRLLIVCQNALLAGIKKAWPGNSLNDIAGAVQTVAEENGFSVVRDFVGHGVGRSLHEEPQVPNFVVPGNNVLLKEGMTLAIEPMVNMGSPFVRVLENGWTVVTQDGKPSAHFEHTIAITKKGPMILTLCQ